MTQQALMTDILEGKASVISQLPDDICRIIYEDLSLILCGPLYKKNAEITGEISDALNILKEILEATIPNASRIIKDSFILAWYRGAYLKIDDTDNQSYTINNLIESIREQDLHILPKELSYETFGIFVRTFADSLIKLLNTSDLALESTDKLIKRTSPEISYQAIAGSEMFDNSIDIKPTAKVEYTMPKDHPEKYHPAGTAIGDTNIWYLPSSISIREFNAVMNIPVLSQKGDAITSTGQRTRQIDFDFLFTPEEVETKLKPLIAQFMMSPILPIENAFVQSVIAPDVKPIENAPGFKVYNLDKPTNEEIYSINAMVTKEYLGEDFIKNKEETLDNLSNVISFTNDDVNDNKEILKNISDIKDYKKKYQEITYDRFGHSSFDKQIAVALKSIQIKSLPGMPGSFHTHITCEITNTDVYGGSLSYIKTNEDVGKTAIQKLVRREEINNLIPVEITQDPGESEPYITNYRSYMKQNMNDSDNATEEDNKIVEFRYSYGEDIELDMIWRHLDVIKKKAKILSLIRSKTLREDKTAVIPELTDILGEFVYGFGLAFRYLSNTTEALTAKIKIDEDLDDDVIISIQSLFPGDPGTTGIPTWDDLTDEQQKQIVRIYKLKELGEAQEKYKNQLTHKWINAEVLTYILSTSPEMVTKDTFTIILNRLANLIVEIETYLYPNYRQISLLFTQDTMRVREITKDKDGKDEISKGKEYNVVFITTASQLANKINGLTPIGANDPMHQHMGRCSWNGTFNIQTDNPDAIKEISRMQERIRELITYKQAANIPLKSKIRHMSISTSGPVFNTIGVKNVVVSDVDYRTIEGKPGLYNITFNYTETSIDRLKPSFEELSDTTENYADVDLLSSFFTELLQTTKYDTKLYEDLKLIEPNKIRLKLDYTYDKQTTARYYSKEQYTFMYHVESYIKIPKLRSFHLMKLENMIKDEKIIIPPFKNKSTYVTVHNYYRELYLFLVHNSANIEDKFNITVEFVEEFESGFEFKPTETTGYYTFLLSKFIEEYGRKDSGFKLLDDMQNIKGKLGDLAPEKMIIDAIKLADVNNIVDIISLTVDYGLKMYVGAETKRLAEVKTFLKSSLRLLELVNMCKIVLNNANMWYTMRYEVLSLASESKIDPSEIIRILDKLEYKRYKNNKYIGLMYDDTFLPFNLQDEVSLFNSLKPSIRALYHPAFYLFKDPTEVLATEKTEFYTIMKRQMKIVESYIWNDFSTQLSKIAIGIETPPNTNKEEEI